MIFKLIRTDVDQPNSNTTVQLAVGTQFIGRGVHCTDKRVSRNHGELIVTDDLVTIRALHQNPCFFQKKGTDEIDILRQNYTKELTVGDKIGLLPDSYWYELTKCDIDDEVCNILETNGNIKEENTDCDDTLQPLDVKKEIGNNGPESVNGQYINPPEVTESTTQDYDIDELIKDKTNEGTKKVKRSHSVESNPSGEVKKIKTEPSDDVEAQPGPSSSNDQLNNEQDPPGADDKDKNDDASAPSKPSNTGPGRERCIYGANCYRKNPAHKAQFCHPSDADWGTGERGVCPWGRACRRREARHWATHDHPPGVSPPPPNAPRPGKRKKQKRNSSSDEDSPSGLILTGKRQRKTITKPEAWYSGSESEEDPFGTDDSDDWQPSTDFTESQDYTQDT